MKRYPDWEKRLHLICRERMRVPFAFGQQDCALFVADAVVAMTGTDLAAEVRGQYDSKESAQTLLAGLTAAGWLEEYAVLVAERNGMQEVGIKLARRGAATWCCCTRRSVHRSGSSVLTGCGLCLRGMTGWNDLRCSNARARGGLDKWAQ